MTLVWNGSEFIEPPVLDPPVGGGGLTPARAVTVVTEPNPVGDGDIDVVTALSGPILAVRMDTDDFARLILTSSGNLILGDGTAAPAAYVFGGVDGALALRDSVIIAGDVTAGDNSADGTQGLRLWSPNGTEYRITVTNGGTLDVAAV